MTKRSAGLLMFRSRGGHLEVFLVHPGGPFFARKDAGVWSIPKGEYGPDEAPLDAARREFQEETGFVSQGEFLPLEEIRLRSGKIVVAWAFAGDFDPALLKSNTCMLEWPPRSGKRIEIPEVDRAEWFTIPEAKARIAEAQRPFLDRLMAILG